MDDDTRAEPAIGSQPTDAGDVPAAPEITTAIEPAAATGVAVRSGLASRGRWVVAAVVTIVVLAAAALAASLLGSRAVPEALRYIPASSVFVMELRPELPGDQHEKVGDLLAHFPGFKDQANLDDKIDESVQLLLDRMSGGRVDYRADVKPWLAGPAYLAMVTVPSPSATTPPFVAAVTTDGTVDCAAILTTPGATTETYEGHDILTVPQHDGSSQACTIDARVAVLGDLDSVHAALDARRDGDGIAGTADYVAAAHLLPADRLAAAYVDVGAFVDAFEALDPAGAAAFSTLQTDQLPGWVAMWLRAEGDALVAEAAVEMPAATGGTSAPPSPGPARVSDLAASLPDTTILEIEWHDFGTGLRAGLDAAKANPAEAPFIDQLEASLTMLGGLDRLVGWMGDTAIVATLDGETPGGGLVIRATDAEAARAEMASIQNLFVLAGSSSGISVDQVDHDGTTITVVDLGNLSDLLRAFGAPGSSLPGGFDGRAALAWAVRDDLVVIGLGEDFVTTVLGVRDGSSLADSDRYQHAIERAGATNQSQGYLDLAATVEYAGSLMTGTDASRWQADLAPWLAPLEGVAFSSQQSGGVATSRVVLTVR